MYRMTKKEKDNVSDFIIISTGIFFISYLTN
jgi:hypothetical protein